MTTVFFRKCVLQKVQFSCPKADYIMFQVLYFKTTRLLWGFGRRVFRMAPLHHHFELCGIKEPIIVAGAYVISSMLALLAAYVGLISAQHPKRPNCHFICCSQGHQNHSSLFILFYLEAVCPSSHFLFFSLKNSSKRSMRFNQNLLSF